MPVNRENISKVYKWLNIDHIFPCLLCGLTPGDHTGLCPDCQQDLPWLTGPLCRCGLPRRPGAPCPGCLCDQLPLATITPCFRYAYPVDRLLKRYKHHRDLACERALGQLWRQHLPDPGHHQALVPVPLHWRRHLWRGFNQAQQLSSALAAATGLPIRPVLRRRQAAPPQQSLGRVQRLDGLTGRFLCRQTLSGQHLILVDDVVTTGATAAACSMVLMASGAASVSVWCLARTLPATGPDTGQC